MITIKNERELESMRQACKITAAARALAGEMVRPGVSTKAIDQAVYDYIVSQGAKPSFLNYNGFPASACISVNETVIHGIPNGYILKEGDIVSVDVGAFYKGFHGDCAATFACGAISTDAQKLIDVTKQSFFEGMKLATKGKRVQDISHAIQTYVESNGFSVVRTYVGHGVGRKLHEEPEVPNFGAPGRGPRLLPGMTIAVEPMVNAGVYDVRVLKDGWTVKTADGRLSAHYENTVLITDGEPEILTVTEGL
ncbi:MAG: type I methionyl aminopeptidase [Eubacteriales bacterium]|nr:type I methionyl aminopeptidase [Eubacteriales bacterium]